MEFSIRTKLWYHGDELSIYGVYPIAFLKQNVLKHLYVVFFTGNHNSNPNPEYAVDNSTLYFWFWIHVYTIVNGPD